MNNELPADTGNRTPTERTLLLHQHKSDSQKFQSDNLSKNCVKLHAGLAYQTRRECPAT